MIIVYVDIWLHSGRWKALNPSRNDSVHEPQCIWHS